MVILKFVSCWFPLKPIWLQETGAAAASDARGFHWIKVTRSLAARATLPSNVPWPTILQIRATLLPFSAASGRRNDCTWQAYASRARIKLDNWANALIEIRFDCIRCSHLNSWQHIGLVRILCHIVYDLAVMKTFRFPSSIDLWMPFLLSRDEWMNEWMNEWINE